MPTSIIYGTPGNDVIRTPDGHDPSLTWDNAVYPLGGSDMIFSGSGNDFIWGEADTQVASSVVYYAGSGTDSALMFGGDNYLVAGSGADDLIGGIGDDTLIGGSGNDELWGGGGNNTLIAGSGTQLLVGALPGETGNTVMYGGNGFDVLVAGTGDDIIIGGSGSVFDPQHPTDGVEWIWGGSGNDWLQVGADREAHVTGGTGNDILVSGTGGGAYTLQGGTGHNVIVGGNGSPDTLRAGPNGDIITGGPGFEVIQGGAGNDQLYGGPNFAQITGGAGGDIIVAATNGGYLDGGLADHARDVIIGGPSQDVFITGGASLQDSGDGSETDLFWNFQIGTDTLETRSADHSQGLGAVAVGDILNGGGIAGTELYNGTADHPVAYLVGLDVTIDQIAAGGHLILSVNS